MNCPFDFDDKLCFITTEICDISPQWLLTTKFKPTELTITQMLPEKRFGFRHVLTQCTGQ